MALPVYMKIKGATQGDFQVEGVRTGHEEEVVLLGLEHEISSPFNKDTGLHTGRIAHGPVKVTKAIDVTSPLLYAAMVSKEQLTVELRWWRASPTTGEEENYHTVTLSNATVVTIKEQMGGGGSMAAELPHIEEVGFAYREIRWNNEISGSEAGDSYARET